jgi:hypothetical protein
MAVIKSGDSTDQLHVDPNRAAFVTLRDVDGNPVTLGSGGLTDTQLRATPVPVDVTFPGTQPVSIAAPVTVTGVFFQATQPVSISGQIPVSLAPGDAPNAQLAATATGVSGAGVTLTLPAVVDQFHYVTFIELVAYTTANRSGNSTPIVVTTTNLPGNPAFTFATAASVGTTDTKTYVHTLPLRSVVSNTATTIVCPATAAIIWRVNVWYQAAV